MYISKSVLISGMAMDHHLSGKNTNFFCKNVTHQYLGISQVVVTL